jgi:hypothetical protein
MNLIYNQRTVPVQWLVFKTIPVFKNKRLESNIENYRPVANLCSTLKIFKKLILIALWSSKINVVKILQDLVNTDFKREEAPQNN